MAEIIKEYELKNGEWLTTWSSENVLTSIYSEKDNLARVVFRSTPIEYWYETSSDGYLNFLYGAHLSRRHIEQTLGKYFGKELV